MAQLTARLDLPVDERSPARARSVIRAVLAAWRVADPDVVHTCELVASELVTNAVLHGGGEVELQLDRHDGLLRIAVSDGSSVLPDPGHGPGPDVADVLADDDTAAELGESGRGLLLVRAVASDWAVEPYRNGKRVVASVELPDEDGTPRG